MRFNFGSRPLQWKVWTTCLVLVAAALPLPATARSITVTDTIEMERFVIPSPYEEDQTLESRYFSPDGRRFVVG